MSRIFYRIPVINVLYDLLFDSHPAMDQLMNVMAALALMSGLLITMAGGLLFGMSPGDCQEIQERVAAAMEVMDLKLLTGEAINPYSKFVMYASLSFVSITASLISLLLMYLGVGCISFGDSNGRESAMLASAWWGWARWIVVLDIALIAVGLTMTCIAHQYLFAMTHGVEPQQMADIIWRDDLFDYMLLVALGVFATLGLLSGGLSAREAAHRKLESAFHSADMPLREFMAHVACHFQIDLDKLIFHTNRLSTQHLLDTIGDLNMLENNDWQRLSLPLKIELAMKKTLYDEDFIMGNKVKMPPDDQAKLDAAIAKLQSVKNEPVSM